MASADVRNLPLANDLASKILCLPIYPDLDFSVVDEICNVIRLVR
jgi:dTDP-4-amino-4,6-dideoxygalactose transaminase